VSVTPADLKEGARRRRVRNGALGLGLVALCFYLAFIALLVFRSRH
jgi:hypothetical protein